MATADRIDDALHNLVPGGALQPPGNLVVYMGAYEYAHLDKSLVRYSLDADGVATPTIKGYPIVILHNAAGVLVVPKGLLDHG